MSLSILPRGVAAKRGSGREGHVPSSGRDEPEEMQVDATNSPFSSTGGYVQDQTSSNAPQSTGRRQNQTPSFALERQSRSNVYQRRPPKPIKPQELCVLIETAMSDHALWTNSDLRRYAADRNTSGYLSLARLLSESPLVQATGQTIAEASVFQALKDHGTGFLELQLKLTNSARNRQKASGDGLYNIRRADWEHLRTKPDPEHLGAASIIWDRRSSTWDERTVYVENIPRVHWSLASALLFIHSCTQTTRPNDGEDSEPATGMDTGHDSSPELLTIQHLELPAHVQASEGDAPVCKGFAFVTFARLRDARSFLETWPWRRSDHNAQASLSKGESDDEAGDDDDVGTQLMNLDLTKEKNEHEEAVKEGIESGLRSTSLNEWEALKEEYLAWQSKLYEGMKPSESGAPKHEQSNPRSSPPTAHSTKKGRERPPHQSHGEERSEQQKVTPNPNSHQGFPQGCLLFVKNLHPQTSKMTLKKLFESKLESALGPTDNVRGGLDYVDWSKGMSSCHLRLSHASTAGALVRYFATHSIIQVDGNDAEGQPTSSVVSSSAIDENGLKPLVVEQVEGRAEEIYWEKVPQKIKSVALAKSNAMSRANAATMEGDVEHVDRNTTKKAKEEQGGERGNKRRRKV